MYREINIDHNLYSKFTRKGIAGINEDLVRIGTFGEPSEIIEVYALVNCLNCNIDIYTLGKKGIRKDKYQN